MILQPHPAATRFPMMDEARLAELVESIRTHGQQVPILLYEGQVLDGRNRARACEMLGIDPRCEQWSGGNPYLHVWALNGTRRDLEPGQRCAIRLDIQQASGAWEAEQEARRAKANEARAESARAQMDERPRGEDGRIEPGPLSGENRPGRSPAAPTPKAHESLAVAAGVSPATAARVLALANKRPDLIAEVRAGTLSLPDATRAARHDEVKAKLDEVAAQPADQADGLFDVLVIDPPWPLQKIERDQRPNQIGLDYPTMTEEELLSLPIPAAETCHVWLWTTHKFLPVAFRMLEAWGLSYVCTFVWHKPGGVQPYGLPQYNCEFALYARRGAPMFLDTKAFPVCFDAPRGAHSEKPEAFYDVVRRVTGGRRIDMFNRRQIEGFAGWGKESAR